MFDILARLKALLTNDNLMMLDKILSGLVEKSPVYDTFWSWFRQQFPKYPKADHMAWSGLKELRAILRKYKGSE
jgi:hypothetical protein